MRLRPDLSYYRRALVNFFLATFANPEVHGRMKFAEVTLYLVPLLQQESREPEEKVQNLEQEGKDLIIRHKTENFEFSRDDGAVNEKYHKGGR